MLEAIRAGAVLNDPGALAPLGQERGDVRRRIDMIQSD
jgi:hypothetical protein